MGLHMPEKTRIEKEVGLRAENDANHFRFSSQP